MSDFEHYAGMYEGKDFLVVGNSYSVTQYDREWYEKFPGVSIGVNRILDYFTPNFYVNVEVPENVTWEQHKYPLPCPWVTSESSKQHEATIVFKWAGTQGVFYTNRDGKVSCGHGTPFIAMSMAYQLGAKRIYLIGMDFKRGPEGQMYFDKKYEEHTQHWYAEGVGYDEEIRARSVQWWKDALVSLDSLGIEVINLSRYSSEDLNFIKQGELE